MTMSEECRQIICGQVLIRLPNLYFSEWLRLLNAIANY